MKILSHSYFASVLVCVFGLGFGMPALAAATYTWTGGAGDNDWTNPKNYEPEATPAAGDIVKVPDGVTVTVSSANAASWALASSLDRIAPQANGSTVVIDVAEGVTNDFNAGISMDATYRSKFGTIEKTGKGMVYFCKSSGGQYDYCGREFWVREGRADFSKRGTVEYFGILRIESGAQFMIPRATTWMNELKGEGDILDPSDYALRVIGGTADEPTVVEARLGSAALHYNCPGFTRILRTDNIAGTFSVYENVTEFIDIGMKNVPSPTGKNGALTYDGAGVGTFRYIGTADTVTDKAVNIANNSSSAPGYGTFDAGPHGGITFNGNWGWTTKSWGRAHLLADYILMGSNTAPCRIDGVIGFGTTSDNLQGDLGIIKRGSGSWVLGNVANTFASVVSVEEGELGFANVLEKGNPSSLGTAMDLKDPDAHGAYDAATSVDYAIRLGSAAIDYPADSLATLRSVAEAGMSCTTRPIALAGDARITSDTGKLVFCGAYSIKEGVNSLVLGGDGTGITNTFMNITDGPNAKMKTGVAKDGAGTWILTGTNSFTGPIAVNGGKLILRRPNDRYTWYRLVVKDSYYIDSKDNYDGFKIGRIGLFDKDGYRQNIGLQCMTDFPQNSGTDLDENIPSLLEPGQYGWGMPKRYNWWIRNDGTVGQGLSAVCRTGECWDDSCMYLTRSGIKAHYADEPNKYLYIDMRLTNGAPEIAYYDIAVVYPRGNSNNIINLKRWSLLGSTDGVSWDELHAVADSMSDDPDQKMKIPTNANSWMAQDKKTQWESAATKHDTAKLQEIASKRTGDPVPFFDAGIGPVTVANGAVLEAEGDITLSKFKAAYGATAGTVKGFALAEDCEIEVTGIPKGVTSFEVPLNFEGAAPEDAEWTVKDGEKVSRRFVAVARDGKLTLIRRGSLIILR